MIWKVREKVPPEVADKLGYSETMNQLLFNRGIFDRDSAKKFFHPDYGKLHSPFLFKDMIIAAKRILLAIENKERIVIHGDYDADGVTAAAVLHKVLTLLGNEPDVFVPSREAEGYGLNKETVRGFIAKKYSLLITVDCGISNAAEVEFAEQNGMDVIITDHHEPPAKLPKALAIINPKADKNYPFRDLAGVGVAFKVAQAVLKLIDDKQSKGFPACRQAGFARDARGRNDSTERCSLEAFGGMAGLEKWLLDLVAIGTVADCMPLLDENRTLVKFGILVLKQTRWLGLQKLLQMIEADFESIKVSTISFQIAPRLNAAGRMNHANQAFHLLATGDPSEAKQIAAALHELNSRRQQLTDKIFREARLQINEQIGSRGERNIYFAFNEKWEIGVAGLVAGKLAEAMARPAVVMTRVNGNVVGSARGFSAQPTQFSLVETFRLFENYFCRLGGHAGACGFTLTNESVIEPLSKVLHEHLLTAMPTLAIEPTLDVEAEAALFNLRDDFIGELDYFEPFGEGNRPPLFLVKNLEVIGVERVGKDGKYLRLFVSEAGHSLTYRLICFSKVEDLSKLRVGDMIDVVIEAGVNNWNGAAEAQYKIIDFKLCKNL